MAAPELYAPRRDNAGRRRAGNNGSTSATPRGSARMQVTPSRRRSLVYRALTTGVALSAIGGFSYFAWQAYSGERSVTPIDDGTVAVIAAADEALKVPPENPGGLAVEGSELEFFDGVTGQRLAVRADEEYVLPPPETPIINPDPEIFDRPPPLPMELAVSRSDNEAAAISPASTAAVESDNVLPTAQPGVTVPPVLSAPMLPLPDLDPGQMTEQSAAPSSDAEQTAVAAAASQPTAIDTLVAAVDAELTVPAQPTTGQPTATQTDVAPAASVQLASMRSQELAEQEWQRLTRLMPDLMSGRQPIIRQSVSNDRTFYRVSVAAADVVEAAALCAEIKNRNFDCIVRD